MSFKQPLREKYALQSRRLPHAGGAVRRLWKIDLCLCLTLKFAFIGVGAELAPGATHHNTCEVFIVLQQPENEVKFPLTVEIELDLWCHMRAQCARDSRSFQNRIPFFARVQLELLDSAESNNRFYQLGVPLSIKSRPKAPHFNGFDISSDFVTALAALNCSHVTLAVILERVAWHDKRRNFYGNPYLRFFFTWPGISRLQATERERETERGRERERRERRERERERERANKREETAKVWENAHGTL